MYSVISEHRAGSGGVDGVCVSHQRRAVAARCDPFAQSRKECAVTSALSSLGCAKWRGREQGSAGGTVKPE